MPAPVGGVKNDPVRVLAYADSAVFSGAEAVLCDVARDLSASPAIELTCVAPHGNRRLVEGLSEATGVAPIDVPAQPLRLAAVHLYDPRRLWTVRGILVGEEPDVLLVNLGSAEYGATPLLLPLKGSKALGFLHVPGGFSDFGFRLGGLRERLARIPMRNLDAVCVLTQSARQTVERVWAGEGPDVHCLPPERPRLEAIPRARAREELGLPDGPIVGMAGRITLAQKGQDTFARAAGLLLHRNPDLRFAVVGEGPDEAALEKLLDGLGIRGRFHLLGQVAPIDGFLSAIDAIAIPSNFEGLGLIALEALELGVPGVASSCDGLRDVWPARWQVKPGEPRELAARLDELLQLPTSEREDAVLEGRRLLDAATADNLGAAMEAIITDLAHEPA
jgi:glycosyltransferase involved in cell wall biosynthesis